jgi:hypothetical protein
LALLLLWANCASAKPTWYLQFSAETLDERAVRQAIALELSEIDIPVDPLRESGRDGEVSLHIEISEADKKFSVSLWDRGELAGRRVASASGDPRVIARRLGLVVAELARDLRDRRLRAARVYEQELRFVERRALVSAYRAQQRALGYRAGLRTEVAPEGAFVVSPTVGVEFNGYFPLRMVAGLSWGAGQVFGLAAEGTGAPVMSRWQLEWGADWLAQPVERVQLSAGLHFAASLLHVGSGTEVDHIEDQSDTYGVQMGVRLGWASDLGLSFWPRVEAEVGRILRPVHMQLDESELRLGGWYFNLGISAVMFQ